MGWRAGQKSLLLPVAGEVFLLTLPFIERAYRRLSEFLVRKHAHTSLAQTAGPVQTQSGPHDYKPAAKKPLPMIHVGYLDEM